MRYIFLDFETTGLDTVKDLPIQIGLIVYDDTAHSYASYTSYIALDENRTELKDIVQELTGIDMQLLAQAPDITIVSKEVEKYFVDSEKDTIIVGHNINFDIAFLKKLGIHTEYQTIDTYMLSQTCLHNVKSYGLEGLYQHLQDNTSFIEHLTTCKNAIYTDSSIQMHHDALYDCVVSYALCLFCRDMLHTLLETYTPYFGSIYTRYTGNNPFFLHIAKPYLQGTYKDISQLPLSEHEQRSSVKVSPTGNKDNKIFLDKLRQREKDSKLYHTCDMSIEELAKATVQSRQKLLLVFSHYPKAKIFYDTCTALGATNIAMGSHESIIDIDRLRKFATKPTYNDNELSYMFFYFSRYDTKHPGLYTQLYDWHPITHYICNKKKSLTTDIIVMTHTDIYTHIQDNVDTYTEYHTMFLDAKWRYITANKFFHYSCDIYGLLDAGNSLSYEIALESAFDGRMEEIHTARKSCIDALTLFVGLYLLDAKKLFHCYKVSRREEEKFFDDGRRNKSASSRLHFREIFEKVQNSTYRSLQMDKFIQHIEQSHNTFMQTHTIRNSLYHQQGSYTYTASTQYTDRTEFIGIFAKRKHMSFITTQNKETSFVPALGKDVHKVMEAHTGGILFVFSTKKEQSIQLYKLYQKTKSNCMCHVENYHGGVKKLIALSKGQESCILIGGYNFYLSLLAQRLYPSNIYIHYLRGPLADVIREELGRYNPHTPIINEQ